MELVKVPALNIVELITINPITRLNGTYQNRLLLFSVQ